MRAIVNTPSTSKYHHHHHQLMAIDVVRTASTESTEDARGYRTPLKQRMAASPSAPGAPFKSKTTPSASWRTKNAMGSIFRSPASVSSSSPFHRREQEDEEDLLTIKRSLAFDEDDDDYYGYDA